MRQPLKHIAISAAAFLAVALSPAGADTAEEHYEYLHTKCGPALQMSKSECDCIVTKARADLAKLELDMVVMFVKENQAGIALLQPELTEQQMLNAMSFVTNTPKSCRNK